MAIDFNKFLKKETPAKTSGIDFSKFIKTPIAPTTPVRTAGLPAFLGGGTYSIQEPGELYKTERGYGAIEAPGEYREHIFPVALGGTSPGKGEKDLETDNIKVYGKDLGEQKSAYENDIIRQYKAGDVTLGQARGLVLKKYRELTGLDPEQKTTFENFVETGIDRLKHPIKATISDIKNIKNIFSKSKEINPQTTQAVKDLYEATKIDPTKPILKNSVEDYIKSIYETDKETIERVKTLFTEKTDTKSEKVGQGLKALTGVAGTIFSPITAAFAASKNIPVLGGIASVINLPLALGGDTLTNLSNEGLNGLVATDKMSKQTAENIREGVNEVASLAAQIGIAGKMFKGRETKVKELEAKYGKRDAETIMKKAEEKATIEAKAKIAIEPKIDFNKFIPKEEVKAEVKTEPIQQEITKAKAEVKSFEEFMKERLSKKDIDNIDKINVIEDSSSIILTDIYALNKGQRTGSKIMNELKDYADLTGKKVRIGMVANQDFFNKFKWLKKLGKQDVIYSYDPNKFILENEYANKLKKIYTEVEDTFKYDNKILAEKQKNLIKKYPEIKENYAIREDGTIRLSEIEDAIKEIEYDNTFDIVKVNVNKIKPVNEEWTKTSRKLKTLEEEIKKDGYIKQPLIVNKVTGLTEDGNHRIIVAKKLGIKEVPVIYINDGKLGLQDLSKTKSELKQLWDKEIPVEIVKARKLEGDKPTAIAKSIEAKAIEKGLIDEGFGELAKFETTTIKEQSLRASELINKDFEQTRRIIRGEEELPSGLRGVSVIKAMEEHIVNTRDADLAYELANSPLATELSLAAQELSVTRGRELDSATVKVQEIKKAREQQAKKDVGKKKEIKKQAKKETEKNNLSKEDLSWDKFLDSITC